MPLVQRSVQNSHAYGTKFLETQHSSNRLNDTHMGGTVGSLMQLSLLADYAADIFKDLIEQSTQLNHRLVKVARRSSVLANQLPEALSFVDGSQEFLGRLDQRPAESMREQTPSTCLLDHASMPRTLLAKYESDEVNRMPGLKQLDLLVAPEELQKLGGTLANKYSNPNFVRDEWIKKKEEENKELAAAKEARKMERKAKKAKKLDVGGTLGDPSAPKKKAFNWRDSMKQSGDVATTSVVIDNIRRSSITNVQSNVQRVDKSSQPPQRSQSMVPTTPVPVVTVTPKAAAPIVPPVIPPPRTSVLGVFGSIEDTPKNEEETASMPVPPPVPATSTPPPVPATSAPPPVPINAAPPPVPINAAPPPVPINAAPLPPPVPTSTAPAPPAPSAPVQLAAPSVPPPVAAPPAPVPVPVQDNTGSNAAPSEAPPPPPKLFRPPPPPPRAVPPPPAAAAAVSTILSAPGAALPPPPPPPARAIGQGTTVDLLTAIRRGSMLKKVDPPVNTGKKSSAMGAFGGTAVESILARRKALQQDDESSSDEDDDDEW